MNLCSLHLAHACATGAEFGEQLLMMSPEDVIPQLNRLPQFQRLGTFEKTSSLSFRTSDLNFFVPSKGGPKQFLHEVDLHIPCKAMVAIMGPSGCGKSTLMNVLSGRAHYGYHTGTGRESGWSRG